MTNVLLLSSINGISSINWMTVWLMMELNTLAMCFIMTKDYNKMKAKKIDTLIYFLTQMMASSIIIILVSSQNMSSSNELLMMLCLITKMGTWPLHLWYIKILSCMELKMKSMLLMMTWQKVLPATMISLMEMSNTTKMITILLCLTSLITPLTKVKYMKPSMIMTLSSLNNNSWIIMASLISMETLLYLIMMYTMVLVCSMKQLDNNPKSLNKTMITMMSYLSLFANLSGMPPFTMFWVKLMVVKNSLLKAVNMNILMIMVVVSCLMVSLYLIMAMQFFMSTNLKTQNTTLNYNKKKYNFYMVLAYSSIIGMFYVCL